MNTEWQPMETAPRDGTPILAYDENRQVFITWYYENAYYKEHHPTLDVNWVSDSCVDFGGWECPIGWMPLPEAPK